VSGVDFLLSRSVTPEDLRKALAASLGLPGDAVEVVGSIEDAKGTTPVLAHVLAAEGDFPAHVALYLEPPSTVGMTELRRLSDALQAAVLVPENTPNPYAMLLIDRGAAEHRVDLDAESLDERGEYRLATR
jgi:hypothetical protein